MKMTLGLALLFLVAACEPAEAPLPGPKSGGDLSVAQAIGGRRSLRTFAPGALSPREVGQLLWAAQGVTGEGGRRTAPSAGALYPLHVYVATGAGLHRYTPAGQGLETRASADPRAALRRAALGQEAIGTAPAVFVITGVEARSAGKYGERAQRYVYLEAGHAAQNLLLQATALDLGGVTIGAFHDDDIARVLGLPEGEVPLYLIPIGRKP